MDKKNSNNKIIIYSIITLAVILIFTWTLKITYNISPKTNIKQAGETKSAQIKIGVKVIEINDKKKIAIYIKPIKDTTLSAFNIGATIQQKGINSNVKLEKPETMIDQSWSFPILKVINNTTKKDNITIEISAFKLGNTPYTISDETVIAYLPIEQEYTNSPVSININTENTNFYAADAVTEILYQ